MPSSFNADIFKAKVWGTEQTKAVCWHMRVTVWNVSEGGSRGRGCYCAGHLAKLFLRRDETVIQHDIILLGDDPSWSKVITHTVLS